MAFSRRKFLGSGCLLFAGASGLVPASGVLADKKQEKKVVGYQYEPRDQYRCGNCRYFIEDGRACEEVAGTIVPYGYCMLWEGRAT